MATQTIDIEDMKRRAMFVPCESREALARWIRVYLDIDLPDSIVCDDDVRHEPTNSSPIDLLWEIYSKALEGTDPDAQNFLFYASRNGGKTLACSIIELLSLIHLRRDVCHLAAIESQSQKCAKYVGRYVIKPIIRDYLTSKNKREFEITFYEKAGATQLTQKQFQNLPESDKAEWKRVCHSMQILVATMSGTNSSHVPLVILDELDLIPPGPFEEAKMIPSVGEVRGELPITLMTSSRKFAYGIVQKELDAAKESGTLVRHWNVIDGTQTCPPERHLPAEPRIPIYYSEDTLKSMGEDDYQLLIDEEKQKWIQGDGYTGCLKNCSIYAVCQSRLATKQVSKSKMLQPIAHVQSLFKKTNVDVAKAQLMSWKPQSTGLIYPRLSRDHCLTSAQMIAKITGEDYDPKQEPKSKSELIEVMRSHGVEFHTGLDHGYTHLLATVTGGLYGRTLFIFHVLGIAGLELGEKINLLEKEIKHYDPTIYPDPAYPADNVSIKRAGFKVKAFIKDVELGINTVRAKLTPTMSTTPEMFFLAGDDGCEMLYEQLSRYHWKLDAAGRPTDQPDKEDDDIADGLRYLCQNLFGRDFVKHPGKDTSPREPQPYRSADPNAGWMQGKIGELIGDNSLNQPVKVKKGGFRFDI